MPANKNAETRYQILDRLLANRYKHYTTEDLLRLVNEELLEIQGEEKFKPVKIRTIQYDLEYLQGAPFLADIEHYYIDEVSKTNPNKTVKKLCHRYADRSFSIYQQKMSEDEKYLLREAMSLLGQFDGLPYLDGLESLRAGLDIRPSRQIISFTKNPLENTTLLGEIFTAISQQVVVEVHYHRFNAPDEERIIVVHPYLLKEYNRRWYLIAAADSDGKIMTLALDRMDKVKMLSSHKYTNCPDNLTERFDDIIGVTLYDNRPVQEIVFWVSDHSKDYVLTKPLHESQHNIRDEREENLRSQYPTLEGGRFFYIECIESYELLRELTSFGKDLIVLSPENIRKKVVERVTEHYKAYQAS